MTNPINYQKQTIPAYSGITINITNPTLNAAPLEANYQQNCPNMQPQQPTFSVENGTELPSYKFANSAQYGITKPENPSIKQDEINYLQAQNKPLETENLGLNNAAEDINSQIYSKQATNTSNTNSTISSNEIIKSPENQSENNIQSGQQQAYPPQYYLNNYNYIQSGEKGESKSFEQHPAMNNPALQKNMNNNGIQATQEEDMTTSKEIIENLDSRVAEQKELEKNGQKTKIVALTNEYIMSLENYLNNPNSEIRLMASKEVLKRLDEDKDRFDDAALNALLNKMLQDPNKLIRIAAMSAFSSQLASGNNYTVNLLKNIQANPNADKEDVLEAANILLKMSSVTEVKYRPAKKVESTTVNNKELEAKQKQVEQLQGQLQKYKDQEIEKMLNIPQGQ